MKKPTIIRVLFSDLKIRKVEDIVSASLLWKYKYPTVNYILGEKNLEFLESFDYDRDMHKMVLVDKKDRVILPESQVLCNKLWLINEAVKVHGEILYLDWDCVPEKEVDDKFYEILTSRNGFQANLSHYRNRISWWRKMSTNYSRFNQKVILNSGFMYIEDKTIPEEALNNFMSDEKFQTPWDEINWMWVLDHRNGEVSIEEYWDKYESMCSNLTHRTPYANRLQEKCNENIYFRHYFGGINAKKAMLNLYNELKEKN